MNRLHIILGLFVLSFAACDEDKIFNEEQYKKMIYFVSDDDQIYHLEYSLDDEKPVSYVSIAASGTSRIEHDVRVTLEKDTILLNKHNYSNFELAYEKYAKEMQPNSFSIPSMSLYLKQDSKDVYATLPIYVDYEKLISLSPDSSYFIPLSIKDISAYSVNSDKNNALNKVQWFNKYAKTRTPVYYSIKGSHTKVMDDGNSTSSITGSKVYYPLARNRVRTFIGNRPFIANADSIVKYSIDIAINDDNSLTLSPYKSERDLLEIVQLPPEENPTFIYKNIYDVEDKRFLLYYKYRVKAADNTWGDWNIMQEANKRIVEEEEE